MSKEDTRMIWIDPATRALGESHVAALADLLAPDDLLVVNDAATLPASLHSESGRGEPVEVRLLEGPHASFTRAVLFGAGDYRTPTEDRAPPPLLKPGATLALGAERLEVVYVSALSPRLVLLRWPGDLAARFQLLYRHGRPVQYSYVPEPVALWDVQTAFAARPWAVEMPSAARPLTSALLVKLRARGIAIACLTHAAGLSATGDPVLDAALPLPERYEIPAATVAQIERTQARRGRVLAVGTSVVRALEDSAAAHGELRAGLANAQLILDADTPRRVTSGLLTGIHVPGESHYKLLSSFVDAPTLQRSVLLAQSRGYRAHEFGDAALILPGISAQRRLAA
jgi:S-adenosylmethionine:tRNA ribosyltransferase-isomerase